MRFQQRIRFGGDLSDATVDFVAWMLNTLWPNSLESIHNRHFRQPGILSDFYEPYLSDTAHRQRFLDYLRSLVEAWINSGTSQALDGSSIHDPWARKPDAAVLRIFEKSCRAHSIPRITFSPSGRIESVLPLLDPEINEIQEGAPEIFAIHWFVHLLNSDRRECLNRCDSCGRYFVRARMPSRGAVTKRGVFCLNHRHLRKRRSITAQRNVETSIVIRAAAQAESRWGSLSSDIRRHYENDDRNYIAEQIELYGKTRKWVTRNLDAIDREAQRLEGNYATR